jgi:signal transduction histidine kinase
MALAPKSPPLNPLLDLTLTGRARVMQESPTRMAKPSPFVEAVRGALSSVSAAASDPLAPAEALVARKLMRELEQGLARLEQKGPPEADLIAIACHDLKDPLASIVMGAGFLKKTVATGDAAAKRVVEAMVRSTDRMSQVIGDFHDMAKLEAGRITVDLRPWDVVAVLQGALAAFETKANERTVRFEAVLPAVPVMAICDRARLIQIVTKLVANAVKFTSAEGKATLRVEAGSAAGAGARIVVTDTGRGIAADRLPTIFDYAANARRTPRDGPGLGLPIAQALALLQASTIEVTSKVDAGSEFSFTLPAPPAA